VAARERLLDQHDRPQRFDVVEPLLVPLRGNTRLVRPVVELHLRDPRRPADLTDRELDRLEPSTEREHVAKPVGGIRLGGEKMEVGGRLDEHAQTRTPLHSDYFPRLRIRSAR